MPQIAPKSIQPPANQYIEPSPLRVSDQGVQRRPTILRAADAAVHVLGDCPASRLSVLPQFLELVFRFLVERADLP